MFKKHFAKVEKDLIPDITNRDQWPGPSKEASLLKVEEYMSMPHLYS